MDLLKFFRREPPTLTGAALRDALIAAAGSEDYGTFATVYNANRLAIREEFLQWLTCPAEIRDDAAATQRYCEGLPFIAKVFQSKGDDTLFNALMRPGDNPVAAWERDVATAVRLTDEGRPLDALTLLEGVLADLARGKERPSISSAPVFSATLASRDTEPATGRVGSKRPAVRWRCANWRATRKAFARTPATWRSSSSA